MIILQANKFFFEKGGSERYLFWLCDRLCARGYEVVHFAMQHPRNLPSPFSRHFVPLRDYETRGWVSPGAVVEFIRSGTAARRLRGLLDEVRPDVAHLHNIYHQLTPSIIEVLAARRIPMVMTLHDYKLVCPSYALFARGATCYRCRGGRFHQAVRVGCGGTRARSALLAAESYWQKWTRVYDRVDCFVAPSAFLRTLMLESGIAADRLVHVAPPDVAGPIESPSLEDASLLRELPERFIAYVGRLSAEKGIGVLLDAMVGVREAPLVVFGEGPARAALVRRAQDVGPGRVRFAGHVSRATLTAAAGRMTALVLPTLSPENAPLAVIEAGAAGVPVIVSDAGGLPELAARLGGWVVPAGDTAALAEAIRDAWRDPEGARGRARAAWSEARRHFDPGAHVEAIETLYRRVVAARAEAAA